MYIPAERQIEAGSTIFTACMCLRAGVKRSTVKLFAFMSESEMRRSISNEQKIEQDTAC